MLKPQAKGQALISVALASYNGEKYLREQLDSIYAQTYPNIEVVACDDGSKDGTLGILRDYQKKFGLKLYSNEKNLGFKQNFAKSVSLCSGSLIALCDQDDIWYPQRLESLSTAMGDRLAVFCGSDLIDEEGKIVQRGYKAFERNFDIGFEELLYNNFSPGAFMLCRAEVLHRNIPIPESERYHDWYWMKRLSAEGKVAFVDTVLMQYRRHASVQTTIVDIPKTLKAAFRKLAITEDTLSFYRDFFSLQVRQLKGMSADARYTQEQSIAICEALDLFSYLSGESSNWLRGEVKFALKIGKIFPDLSPANRFGKYLRYHLVRARITKA